MTCRPAPALLLVVAAGLCPVTAHAQDLYQQARDLQRRGQLDSAYNVIQHAADAEPNRAEVHFALGEIAGQRAQRIGGIGAYGTARKCKAGYARAVQLQPDSVPYLEGLIGNLTQAPGIVGGDKDSALVLARRVRRLDESRGIWDEVTVLRAGNDRKKQQADSLAQWYGDQHPTDRTAQLQLAAYYNQSNRFDRAMPIIERLVAHDSTDGVARFSLGRNMVVLKRDQREAQRHLRYVLTRPLPAAGQPRWSVEAVWWRLGQSYVLLGMPDSARAMYEESLRLNPQFRQARASLDSLNRH